MGSKTLILMMSALPAFEWVGGRRASDDHPLDRPPDPLPQRPRVIPAPGVAQRQQPGPEPPQLAELRRRLWPPEGHHGHLMAAI